MADIRNYTREKEKREKVRPVGQGKLRLVKSESEDTYQEKIRKHRLSHFYRIALVALVCIAIVVIVAVQYNNKIYEDYDVAATTGKVTVNGATDIALGSCIL